MTAESAQAPRQFQYKHGDRPLDGYTIQRGIGRGGFGEVYYAVSDGKKDVALKVTNSYEQIEMRGTTQCINLKSPNLVTIYDVKTAADGRPWIVMEFISGPTLADIIRSSPGGIGPEKAAFFLHEIARGLNDLHECGIVHRDLSPSNIFLEHNTLKIGDYGLSKAMTMTQHSGQTVVVGKLHYMAPEIGFGKYGRTTDVYALGVILYEMMTGKAPFDGSTWGEVIIKHSQGEVNLEGINEPFRSVIARAMAKDPAQRFQSAGEMVQALCGLAPAAPSAAAWPAAAPAPPRAKRPATATMPSQSRFVWTIATTVFAISAALMVLLVLFLGVVHRTSSGRVAMAPEFIDPVPRPAIQNSSGIELAWIGPGSFMMGDSADPARRHVSIRKGFYMAVTPTTQAQWRAVMGNNPSHFRGDNLPVDSVSYPDALAFCAAISSRDHYRLPTEAEWEYACRARTSSEYYTGNGLAALMEAGWCRENSGDRTQPVQLRAPNAWGLFDMHGNVWEWCGDVYPKPAPRRMPGGAPSDTPLRVRRGGAWDAQAVECRSAARSGAAPDTKSDDQGFRVVLDY